MKFSVFKKNMATSGGSGAKFLVGHSFLNSVTNPSSTTRFHVFRKRHRLPFVIIVDPNGGVVSESRVQGFAGEKIGTLPSASRGDDWLEGWSGKNGCTVTDDTIVSEDVSVIKPEYTPVSTLSFTADSAIDGPSSINVWVGHELSSSGPLPRAGKSGDLNFNGWYTPSGEKVSGGTIYDGSYSVLEARYSSSYYEVYNPYGWDHHDDGDRDVYRSTHHIDDYAQKLCIHVSGYEEFRVVIRSEAESNYDYTVAFVPDHEPSESAYDSAASEWDYNENAYASTCGRQWEDVEVVYHLDGGEHDLWFTFRKDGSVAEDPDVGYVYIPKGQ